MNVMGEASVRGSAEAAWDALHDAAVLARAIPGCERFEVSGPGIGEFVATTALPAIGGTYAGKLAIAERQRPDLLRLTLSATGDQATVAADVTVRLGANPGEATPLDPPEGEGADATTLVSYEANGTVTGPASAAGTRLLTVAAKRLASEFFAAIDESVAAQLAASESLGASAAAPSGAAPVAAASARVGSEADRPGAPARRGSLTGNRTALVAGAAIGLAGVLIGVLAGRRSGRARA